MATIYELGFEEGVLPKEWSAFSPTGKATTWAVGIPNGSANAPPSAYAGSYVLATNPTGNHATDEESVADVEIPPLTYWSGVVVTWAGWLDLVNETSCGAQIHLSTDGGATFTGVNGAHISPSYNVGTTTAGGVILDTVGRWTGLAPGAWTVRTLDLDAALGAAPRDQVVLRFAFEARPAFAGRAGWYIDAFQVTGTVSDTVPPEVAITTGTIASASPFTVAGTSTDDGVGVVDTEIRVNGGDWSVAVGAEEWSAEVDLEEGPNLIEVRSTDAFDNVSEVVQQTVTLDTADPVVTITSPSGSGTDAYQLQATIADDTDIAALSYTLNGGASVPVAPGNVLSEAVVLAAGLNTIVVTAEDEAGNTGSAELVVDHAAPSLAVTSGQGTSVPSYTLTGTASDDSDIEVAYTLNAGASTPLAVSGGAFRVALTLTPGINTVVVTATDEWGNATSVTHAIGYQPPVEATSRVRNFTAAAFLARLPLGIREG